MITGLILVTLILVLGGAIATIGDRIGTKVGKARLSLFNLRPRKTAVLVTLMTGMLISGSTLALAFAANVFQLRTRIFEVEKIQKNLRKARKQIETTSAQKHQVENALAQAKSEQATAQQRLDGTNQTLQAALAKLSETAKKQSDTAAQLNQTQNQLGQTQNQLIQTQNQLNQSQTQLNQTQNQLGQTENNLKTVSEQVNALRGERENLIAQRKQLQAQISSFKAQVAERDRAIAAKDKEITQLDRKIAALVGQRQKLQVEISNIKVQVAERDQAIAAQEEAINQLDQKITALGEQRNRLQTEISGFKAQVAERDQALAAQDQAISQLDQTISARDQVIAQRESRLKQLETQRKELENQKAYLQRAITVLGEYYQDYQALRGGNLVLFRNQVLASGVLRIVEPKAARQAVDQLLVAANRKAIENTRPGAKTFNNQVIKITQTDVDRLVDRIDDGQDYLVRILSSANYVRGETIVEVFADVAPNRIVFQAGEIVATTSTNPATMSQDQLVQRMEQLIAASQFRARRAGILAEKYQIGDDRIETLMQFIEQLKQSNAPVDVQVVASEVTYTAGPLKMDLVAVKGGQILFRTSPAI